jgi:hypothetical protein
MKTASMLALVISMGAAQATPLSVICQQAITQTNYAANGQALPTQHITGTIRYSLDFLEPSVSLDSGTSKAKFTNGGAQHILVDHDGMTLAGTTRFPNDGPVTSQITHFSADGRRGSSERKLSLHGKLLQVADTQMTCAPMR